MDAIELNMSRILDDIGWGQTTPEMGANDPFSDVDAGTWRDADCRDELAYACAALVVTGFT